jgi:hypothetical protein
MAQTSPTPTPTSSDLGQQSEQPMKESRTRVAGGGIDAMYQGPWLDTFESTESITSRGGSRSPRDPSYRDLHRFDFPSSLKGLLRPAGEARQRSDLETSFYSQPSIATQPKRTYWGNALQLAYWNADGVRGGQLRLTVHQRTQCRRTPLERDAPRPAQTPSSANHNYNKYFSVYAILFFDNNLIFTTFQSVLTIFRKYING